MELNTFNQNRTTLNYNLNSYMSSDMRTNLGINNNSNSYYAKKGEPTYQKDMDTDDDGIVTFDEFKNYCKENDISAKEMMNMLNTRNQYQLSKETSKSEEQDKSKTSDISLEGSLDLIYAKDGDKNYDSEQDTNNDSKVSYNEYLRYCEKNAKMEYKNSDTKVVEDDKKRFMTVSFGHAFNAYNKNIASAPEIKAQGKV